MRRKCDQCQPTCWCQERDERSSSGLLAAVSTLFTEGVLIAPFLPDPNIFPWLCWEEILERATRKYCRLVGFAITVLGSIESSQQPHGEKRNRCPKGVARFGS